MVKKQIRLLAFMLSTIKGNYGQSMNKKLYCSANVTCVLKVMHLFINRHISVEGDLNPRALRILTWIFVAFISDLQCCGWSVNICCSGLERKKRTEERK